MSAVPSELGADRLRTSGAPRSAAIGSFGALSAACAGDLRQRWRAGCGIKIFSRLMARAGGSLRMPIHGTKRFAVVISIA